MKTKRHDAVLEALHAFGMRYPGAHEKSPWPGHRDLAVNDKTFAYLTLPGEPLRISCKLPHGNAMALSLPYVVPAAYGLGKSGWVTATFAPTDDPDVGMLKAWIDESYRAQAPKKLLRELEEGEGTPASAKKAPAKTAAPVKKAAPAQKAAPAKKKAVAKKRGA